MKSPAQCRYTYLRTSYGKLTIPSDAGYQDGIKLAQQCLASLDDRSAFPPRIFILWATPRFQPYQKLLEGVDDELAKAGLDNVPLIGSSVAACRFDGSVYEHGALLICLASRFLSVRAGAGRNAQHRPEDAAVEVFESLRAREDLEANPRGDRILITFLPGYAQNVDPSSYKAPEVLEELQKQFLARVPMFGGVSSAGLDRGQGYQFLNRQAFTGTAVAALVASDLSSGIGLSHRLAETNHPVLHVKDVADNGRTITNFFQGTPAQVMAEIRQSERGPLVFEFSSSSSYPMLAVPELSGGQIQLHRAIHERSLVRVLRPDPALMLSEIHETQEWMRRRMGMQHARMAALFTITCVAPYRMKDRIGLNVSLQEEQARKHFPGIEFAGCYMDGEIGLNRFGRTTLANWSVAQLLLADQLTARSHPALGFETLRRHTPEIIKAQTIPEAMDCVLACVEGLGYPGSMIAPLFQDRDAVWLVGKTARGQSWNEHVAARPRSLFQEGQDVVTRVLRGEHGSYIRDMAELGGDQPMTPGGVVSQYVMALRNEKDKPIGALQIDLGDTSTERELRKEQETVLLAMGDLAAVAVNRAMQSEELSLARQMAGVLANWEQYKTEKEAVDTFVGAAAHALKADVHVRLFVPGETRLYLAGGCGSYFNAAKRHGAEIDVMACPPFQEVRESDETLVLNDFQSDTVSDSVRMAVPEGMASEVDHVRALAIVPIAHGSSATLAGFLVVSAPKPWFFTQARRASLTPIGSDLSLLLTDVRRHRLQTFMQQITPTLEDEKLNLLIVLRKQAQKLKEAACADAVSFYLHDEDRKRHVLRAEVGWKKEAGTRRCRWVHAAWYGKEEWLDPLDGGANPGCFLYSAAPAGAGGGVPSKHHTEMFGEPPQPGESYEVIALPLSFQKTPLGIVTLHRKKARLRLEEDLCFADLAVALPEVCRRISIFVGAHVTNNKIQWHEQELDRHGRIDEVFLK